MGGHMDVTHHPHDTHGEFALEESGKRLGRMTYSRQSDLVSILHTEVDPSLRGQGAGERLVTAAVEWAREEGHRVLPICPYAKAVFARHPEYGDVL